MGVWELIFVAVGLSMDAFAVAICKGLSIQRATLKSMMIVGLYFGIFQAAMPVIGYFAGSQFAALIENIDHWIAFGLLSAIGIKMLYECFKKSDNESDLDDKNASLAPKVMLPLALATSIDALAMGVSFAVMRVDIALAVALIGGVTFAISATGVKVGNTFGSKIKSKAEFLGGVILILIGIKILIEHLGMFAS